MTVLSKTFQSQPLFLNALILLQDIYSFTSNRRSKHRVYTILKTELPKERIFDMHCFCFLIKKETVAEGHRILIKIYDDVTPLIKTCEY